MRLSVAARHSRSCVYEHESHRLAYDIGSPEDGYSLPHYRYIIVREERHDPLGRATPESLVSEIHIPDLLTGESIDILDPWDTLRHSIAIDMRGERCLDDDPMDTITLSQTPDCLFELSLSDRRRIPVYSESHPDFAGTFLLHPDIRERCWIVSDEDDCERWTLSLRSIGDLGSDTVEDGGGDDTPIEDLHGEV
jgi:hypothetical protein